MSTPARYTVVTTDAKGTVTATLGRWMSSGTRATDIARTWVARGLSGVVVIRSGTTGTTRTPVDAPKNA